MSESEGERRACEGRGGEVSSRAGGTEMPESTNEEDETQAIAKETNDRCAKCNAYRRKLRAEAERKHSVHEPAKSPFHIAICDGSLPEIFRVRLLSIPQQIQAAAISIDPLETANPSRGSERRMPPKTDKRESRADAFVHVFPENDPCNSCSRDSFEIEQQGGGAGWGF